jgi:hypothetical protein
MLYNHIFKDHWELNINNFLETVNNPTKLLKDVIIDWVPDENIINLYKKIPWTKDILLVGAEKRNWFFVVTHFKIENGDLEKIILNKWTEVKL